MAFQNLKGGQRVRFWIPNGISAKGQEWAQKIAKVQPLLTFSDHVVVNLGGKYGTPYVVDANNFIEAL
jgi:hypothetical protein